MNTSEVIYLDNHSTTRLDPGVLEAMLPFFSERYGNAASTSHAFGHDAAEAVGVARGQVAQLVGADPREIIFTSGATEANNLALKGAVAAAGAASGHLVTTAVEHPSVLDTADRLARSGCELSIVGVDRHGRVDPDDVAAAIRPETILVSVMWANNEVGTINPVDRIAAVCRNAGVLFHTDAVQAAGRVPVDVGEIQADLVSLSAHKLYGPKGIGALVVRRGAPRVRLQPLFDGGGHESHLRSGTLPVPLIVGFGRAAQLAAESQDDDSRQLEPLVDQLWQGLSRRLDELVRHGHPVHRLPGNLNVGFGGVDGDALLTGLSRIAVSSGSACTTAVPEPSHVLSAMDVDERLSRASLRFGLDRFNTADDIEVAIEDVVAVVERLRAATTTPR